MTREAFDELYRSHKHRLVRLAHSRLSKGMSRSHPDELMDTEGTGSGLRNEGLVDPPHITSRSGSLFRVIIAEEDFIAREGIRCIVDSLEEIEIVGLAGVPETLSYAIQSSSPDAVLFGFQPVPLKSEAVSAALQIRSEHPDLALIVLTYELDGKVALDLLSQGSAGFGYLLRQNVTQADQLLEAIHSVMDGGLVLDPSVVDSVLQAERQKRQSHLHGLTNREHEVLTLMATGQSNAAIASSLVLSKPAVERHINAIFRKLGLKQEHEVSQRVKAVLFHLKDAQSHD
jgi:DNA-binding NarL/FixJ family response regulator